MEEEKNVNKSSDAQDLPKKIPTELTEEEKLREDKKRPDEEEAIPELIPAQADPNRIAEARNQAGPSTPRPSAQKVPLLSGSPEPEGTTKLIHDLAAESPESKRLKPNDATERRLEVTQLGDDIFHHLDKVVGQEDLWAYEHEAENNVEEAKHDIP